MIPKKTILVTNRYEGGPLALLQSFVPEGMALRMPDRVTREALIEEIQDADYLLASGRVRICDEILAAGERLKMIQRIGVGLDALDLDAIRRRQIPLYVNRGVNAESVAEQSLLLMLACLRRLPETDANTRAGVWIKEPQGVRTHELRGKTVGLVGMGNIARRLCELLNGFGVTILYNSRSRLSEEQEQERGLRWADREELFRESDIVSLHCSLNDETKGLINRETLSLMKDGAILINTARGQLVRTQDLAEALRNGKLACAGLDVHEIEPIPEDYALKALPNVILTPHIAGITQESFSAMMGRALRNIELYDRGELGAIEEYRYKSR